MIGYSFSNHLETSCIYLYDKTEVLDFSGPFEVFSIASRVCPNDEPFNAFLLDKAHVITTQKLTTHWEDIADLKAQFPKWNVIEGVRWVEEGHIITSAGISADIDMSLHLVSQFHSLELAEITARQMNFDWAKTQFNLP